jgi:phosphatidylglycerol:prolipoprotein diacylglycerol transferase
MHPLLFKIPFTELTVKSYGFMMVVGFLTAIYIVRRLSKRMGHDPEHITNVAIYSLITGIIGARIFYVVHYWDNFKDSPIEVFSVWKGGLELLGGVISAILMIIIYLWVKKLPIRRYLDILAIGLMIALAFGRIGCLLNGCCHGKPCSQPWAITFPYASIAYASQIYADPARDRTEPYFTLPDEFYRNYFDQDGQARRLLLDDYHLTFEQRHKLIMLKRYHSLPVHPTQIYSSIKGLLIAMVLYLFWKRGVKAHEGLIPYRRIYKAGTTSALMLILYGPARFLIEFFRDGNPYEIWHLTISQIMGAGLFVLGLFLMLIFTLVKDSEYLPEK